MDKESLKASIEKNIRFSYSHCSGNGGQNVNKLNTKVQAFIAIDKLEGLSQEEKKLVCKRLQSSINQKGELFAYSQEERSQELNRKLAFSHLYGNILSAAQIQAKRKKTKPSKAMKEKRLKDKKLRSAIKHLRSEY